jgi:transposase
VEAKAARSVLIAESKLQRGRATCRGGDYPCGQITEVLRLNAQGLSYRQIAQSVGISASTVQSYRERAQRAGLHWPLPDDVDDAALEARLFTRSEEELRPGRPELNRLEVHREHKRGKHVTLQLLAANATHRPP